ncbi:DMT family transporter [Paenirhodobacter sp.]|uniref:DMT family transporter n=1 Tax=Paenirhodobacter sp. TaxID=1965326 RepID=UPI003B3CA92E
MNPRPVNPRNGIVLKILAALCATLMLACVKGLDGAVPTGQVVFFRSFVALLPLLIWLAMQGNILALVRTQNFGGHLVRGFSGTGGMFFNYLALAYIPLADATALSYAAPLFTVFLAAVLLHEKVRIYRWTAVVVGFLGVLIMLSPHLEIGGDGLRSAAIIGSVAALIAALCSAISSVQIRHLNASEQPGAIVLYFSLMTTGIGLATIFLGWVMPTPVQLLLLIGCGVFGGMAQILVTLSLRHAHASLLAPFEYTTMVWSILIGIVVLDQSPAPATIVGAIVVAAAGLFTIWRERALKRAAAR